MKILFNNIAENYATISAGSESPNYPSTNIVDPFLHLRYQPLSGLTDTITITWSANQVIDCFFCGYHTMSAITVNLRDSVDALLYTFTDAAPDDILFKTFTSVSTVRKVELVMTFSASPAYLGGVGMGACYQMPDRETSYSLPMDDNSTFSQSPSGQVGQVPRDIMDSIRFSFRDQKLAVYQEIKALYKTVKKGKPLFVAPYNEGIDGSIGNLYAFFTREPRQSKTNRRYDIQIEMKEAK